MIDAYNREITYLRVSLTSHCNLQCAYCMPNKCERSMTKHQALSTEELLKLIKAFVHVGIKKVRLTGGEPLLYPDLIKIIEAIKGFEGIEELTMTTNGILLAKKAKALKAAGLDRVNISLDTLDQAKYKNLTGGGEIEKVFQGIKAAREAGLTPVRINVVLMKEVNKVEIEQFVEWTRQEPVDIRFIEMMSIGDNSEFCSKNHMSIKEVLSRIDHLVKIISERSSVASYYKVPGAKGRIGVIPTMSQHFCDRCNRVRINAMGELKPCLLNDLKVDLKKAVREEVVLEDYLEKIIKLKPRKHNGVGYEGGKMFEIGG